MNSKQIWAKEERSGGTVDYHLAKPHCAKVQKYEQGKIGLQFFDIWY